MLQRFGNPDKSAPSSPQIDRLNRQLAQAQSTARRNGCTGTGRSFRLGANPQCRTILAQVNQLNRQLRQWRARSGGRSFRATTHYDIARMRKRLAAQGCAGSTLDATAAKDPPADNTARTVRSTASRAPARPTAGGRRTLCVRLCDGYYFPIEFRARYRRFKIDAAACQSMYAGEGQAELFVQPTGRDVADARSLSGARYGDQPYAFAYRESYTPACVAELHRGVSALAARYFSQIPKRRQPKLAVSSKLPPHPQIRQPLGEDPETLANAVGHFSIEAAAPATALADARVKPARMVGPAYYAKLFDLTRPRTSHGRPRPIFSIVTPAMADERALPTSMQD